MVAAAAANLALRNGRILSVGLAVSLMPTLYDLLSAMGFLKRDVVLTQYSVALFVMAVGVIVARLHP